MSDPPKNNLTPNELPQSLREQLKQFRGQLWHIKIMEAVWSGFFGLLLSYLLVFTLDRFIPTSGIVRLLILIAGISAFAIFAPLWINRWVFKHRRENQIAQLIAKQYPRLGDRLIGVVELQNQHENDNSLSPRLREAAMAQVAHEFSNRNLKDALPITWHKKWALAVIALVALTLAAWLTTPKAGANALQRWLMPFAPIERYTETKIDHSQLTSPHYVAQGEPFELTIQLTKESNSPTTAQARLGVSPWLETTQQLRSYHFSFPKVFKKTELDLHIGDLFHTIEVQPIARPVLDELTAVIQFPSYLQKEDQRLDITSGHTAIVEGSRVTLSGKVNRALLSATTQPEITDKAISTLTATVQGAEFTLPPLEITHEQITLPLVWTDTHGLSNLVPSKLSIDKLLDSAPTAYLENTPETIYVLAEDSIKFDILAEDDFGLKQAGFEWQGTFTKPSPHRPAKGELKITQGDPHLKQASESIDFSFQAYAIHPQKLSIRAWAEDYKEGRQRVYSPPITVYVLTKSEHRELMQKRSQKALHLLEDLMRSEQQLLDQNRRLEKLSGEDLQKPDALEKLAEQSQKERDNAAAMQDIAKTMQGVFEEASKNSDIDSATLKELAKTALQMKQMAEQKMPDIAKKIESAQSKENTAEKSQEELADAVKKQAELLKEMEKTLLQGAEANKQLEVGTFVNRLRQAAEEQDMLAQALLRLMTKPQFSESHTHFIISEFEALDPAMQREVLALYSQQQQTRTDIHWIEEDLGHFYQRTQQEEHKTLLEKMQNSSIREDLSALLLQLERSENYLSIERSTKIAALLKEWAKELDAAAKKKQDANGGGGSANSDASSEDFEFMLRVLRLIQQETAIRSNIRSLEQKKRLLDSSATPPTTPSVQ